METDLTIPSHFERLPVFPLPDTVLFPGTILPLHIFEPRYRDMVRDCIEGDGCMAVAMLHDDADPMDERPMVYKVGCAGKLIHVETLEDGRYNVLLQGLERVHLLEEVDLQSPYRRFRAEAFPSIGDDAIESASHELGRLQSCVLSLTALVEKKDADLLEVLRATPDPLKLADILGAALVSDPKIQQLLLCTTDLRLRLNMLIEALADVMVRVSDPPESAKLN